MEERLNEFKAAPPPPGLKERVLAAARKAPRPGLIDRLWTRKTWGALAAAFLAAIALCAISTRPSHIETALAAHVAKRAFPANRQAVDGGQGFAAMRARLRGPNALKWEDFR